MDVRFESGRFTCEFDSREAIELLRSIKKAEQSISLEDKLNTLGIGMLNAVQQAGYERIPEIGHLVKIPLILPDDNVGQESSKTLGLYWEVVGRRVGRNGAELTLKLRNIMELIEYG